MACPIEAQVDGHTGEGELRRERAAFSEIPERDIGLGILDHEPEPLSRGSIGLEELDIAKAAASDTDGCLANLNRSPVNSSESGGHLGRDVLRREINLSEPPEDSGDNR